MSGREEFGGRFSMEQRVLENRLQFNGSLSARRVNETWEMMVSSIGHSQ